MTARRRVVFNLALALSSCPLAAQGAATDLTVRLYSTRTLASLAIVPINASMQPCTTCARTLVPPRLDLRTAPPGTVLLANGRTVHTLLLEGQLRVLVDSAPPAVAAGHWKISAAPDGLHVLLTFPSERYVMAVLSSEAAPDEPPESLKALAVAARSFALTNPHRHGLEGLCDSTHCQALRLDALTDRVRAAVLATAGETLWHGAQRVPAYFTQDCGGATEDAATLWGGAPKPWLVSHPDPYCQRQPAHWHADIKLPDLRRALAAEGFPLASGLTGARILSRDRSGRAAQIELTSPAQLRVISAATFRFAVNRSLGWNTLRSDWYTLTPTSAGLAFDGKGYGHGVGLCQAGAAQMARQGSTYREILGFYFPATDVRITAADLGWHTYPGHGFNLRATAPTPILGLAADETFARAQTIFPPRAPVSPTVTLYPTTELFRQATGQPGWTLASTQGSGMALQPLPVIQSHTTLSPLLLHEFLHALIEQEAAPATPLWFREGLVEALTNPAPNSPAARPPVMSLPAAEAALHQASSLAEAQRAHRTAGVAVQYLIATHGLATVRGWLHSGIPAALDPILHPPQ
jgi:stage II sporulation protein D